MPLGRFSFNRKDVLFQALMSCSAAIELGIFLSQAVWLFRTRKIRRRAKEAGLDWDEFPEAQAWQEDRLHLRWKWRRSDANAAKETTEGDAVVDGCVPVEESQKAPDQSGDIEQCRPI